MTSQCNDQNLFGPGLEKTAVKYLSCTTVGNFNSASLLDDIKEL